MEKELFELCKQVYEATGWDEVEKFYWGTGAHSGVNSGRHTILPNVPLYTSDYLLEKLPKDLTNDSEVYPFVLYRGKWTKQWLAGYEGYFGGQNDPCDTPLKALLKLTLALHEAGELK